HMRVEDYAGYEVNGVRMNAAIFVGDGSTSFAEWHYLSLGDLQTKFNNYYAQGLYLSDLTVTELSSGRSYGGVWRPQAQGAPAYVNMTPADYQAKFDQFAAQGYCLRKIQGYANSGQFAAIWMK